MIGSLTTRRLPRNASLIGTAGLATLSILVAGCASSSGASGSKSLPQLHIGTGTTGTGTSVVAAGEANVPAAAAPGPMVATFGGYVLGGTLPTTPTAARIWQWTSGRASADDVSKLGSALNLDGTPVRHAYGWELETSGGDLRVSDLAGNQWTFNRVSGSGCATQPIDIDDPNGASTAVGCAVPVAPGAWLNGPDDAATRAAAAGLVSTLGLAGPQQFSTIGPGESELTMSPEVGGSSTSGIETYVSVDNHGIVDASGWLAAPSEGANYPLRSAESAFAELGNEPRPMLAPYCGPIPQPITAGSDAPEESASPVGVLPSTARAPDAGAPIAIGPAVSPAVSTSGPIAIAVASPPPNPVTAPSPINAFSPTPVESPVACPTPKTVTVTGATLGLQLEYDGDDSAGENPILVPTWTFTTSDGTQVGSIVAIDPSFLGGQSTGGSGESGAGSTSAGTVTTGPASGAAGSDVPSDVPGATTGIIDPAAPTP
jgi:hypothetical protein